MTPLVSALTDAAQYWVPVAWNYLYQNAPTINQQSLNLGLSMCGVLGNVGFACAT